MKQRQHGAALLAAMLTVTLVATFAAAAMWQQWRAVEVEGAERTRVQSAWILTGALDWARLILREDGRTHGADHLAEPWAVPLAEARLSTFLAADRNNTADHEGEDAFLSGQIVDLQSLLNVTNLVEGGSINDSSYAAFGRLFNLLGLPQSQLQRLTENLRFASDISLENRSAAQAPLLPQRVSDLAWLGLPQETIAALEPYVTVLERRTPVNLNTASAEVIYAVLPGISLADARRLVAEREGSHFRDMGAVAQSLGLSEGALANTSLGLSTNHFEVRGRLRVGIGVVEERSVVRREGTTVTTLTRERGTLDPAALTRAVTAPGAWQAPPTMQRTP